MSQGKGRTRGVLIASAVLVALGLVGVILRFTMDLRLFTLGDGIMGLLDGPRVNGGVGRLQVLLGTLAGRCFLFIGAGLFVPFMMCVMYAVERPTARWEDSESLSTGCILLTGIALCAMGYLGALFRYFTAITPQSGEAVMRRIEEHPLNPLTYLDGGINFMAYAWAGMLIAGAVFLVAYGIGAVIDGHVDAKRKRGEVSKALDTALKVLSAVLPLAFSILGTRPLMERLELRSLSFSWQRVAALYALNFLMPMFFLRQWNHVTLLPKGPAMKLLVGTVTLPVCFAPGVALAVYLHRIVGVLIFVGLFAAVVAFVFKGFSHVDVDALLAAQAAQEEQKRAREEQEKQEHEAYIRSLENQLSHDVQLGRRERRDLWEANARGETHYESTREWARERGDRD